MIFRLHIDIPLSEYEGSSIAASEEIVTALKESLLYHKLKDKYDIKKIQYRLSHDNDRQKRNYLVKDENGHVSTNKSKVEL